jgi:hypothetical protein
MVVVVMVKYLWSSDGDVGDVDCCYGARMSTNIRIFEYFGARINICIRFYDKVHIRIYSNIRSVL